MSRYGIDFYGSGVSYGTGSSTVYVADGFVAKSVDYSAIKLEWAHLRGLSTRVHSGLSEISMDSQRDSR